MKKEIAIFGAGCFWEVELEFSKLKGVVETTVGFSGGNFKNPSYKDVCYKRTGHAEVVRVTFDPKKIFYKELLDKFWEIHNPTTKNRQGFNFGSQYRSIIFYFNEKQKKEALVSRKEHQKDLKRKIVTEILKAKEFYEAEEYHQDYLRKKMGTC